MFIPKITVKKINTAMNVKFICDLVEIWMVENKNSLPFAKQLLGRFPNFEEFFNNRSDMSDF